MTFRYDPRTEPCLTVLTTEATPRVIRVGLVRALAQADDFATIVGSTPGEQIAVVEYLLALLYASEQVPQADADWYTRVVERLPFADAAEWLRRQPDEHWNLFDPVQPLAQNADLAPFLDRHGVGPAQIVIEQAGDYNQFFDHTHLHHDEPMPADVAFRALLTQMVYGLGGNAKVRLDWLGPLLFPQAVARLGGRLRVLALGRTLGDTLRLNLTPTSKPDLGTFNRSWTDGRSRRSFRGAKVQREPDGPADAHSYLCRSILLRPTRSANGEPAVDRLLMGSGEALPRALSARFLQDAVLVQAKGGIAPLKAGADRALWREAYALYAATADRDKDDDLYGRLASLPGTPVSLWVVGLVSRKSTPVAWVSDEFPYIPGREMDFLEASKGGSAVCEYTAKALTFAAEALCRSLYPNPSSAEKSRQTERFNAAPDMWAEAGNLFHDLLDVIAQGREVAASLVVFATAMRELAFRVLDTRLRALPAGAARGLPRLVAENALRRRLNGPKAPYPIQEAARG